MTSHRSLAAQLVWLSLTAACAAEPGEQRRDTDPAIPDGGEEAVDDAQTSEDVPPEVDASPSTDAGGDSAAGDAGATATVRDASWLDGFWEGETSQGLPLKLEVVVGGISRIEIGWNVGPCGSTTIATFQAQVPVTNHHFERKVNGGAGGITFTLTGMLGDDDRGSGTFDYMVVPNRYNPGCTGAANGTFHVQRVGPSRRAD